MREPTELQKREEMVLMLKRCLVAGDFILHKRCLGHLEEHRFTGWDGHWVCGTPTPNTISLGGMRGPANDIAPSNITHINRVPIDDYEEHLRHLRRRDQDGRGSTIPR